MIYIPKHFDAPDFRTMQALMRHAPFATLVSARADDVHISHLPVLHDTGASGYGTLSGHFARANPHWHWLAQGQHLVIFHGPHRYISPAWYHNHPSVPTWNYAVVHARGPCALIEDPGRLRQLTEAMTSRFERENGTDWTLPDDPAYLGGMLSHIVGFTLDIEDLQGKFKLSQNRSAEDRGQVLAALRAAPKVEDTALLDLMTSLDALARGPSL